MAQIAALQDVTAGKTQRQTPTGYAWRTNFLMPDKEAAISPMAFLAEGTPHRVIPPHFHQVDQFQVIVHGGGVLGRHPLSIHAVHFSRAHTPYGPIVFSDAGLGFLTLRSQWDPGAQYLPDAREKLEKVEGRTPWQITEAPVFGGSGDVNLHSFAQIKDERGLAAYAITLKPNASTPAPDPSNSNGQYLIVTKGSLLHQGKDHNAITIVFVKPDEPRFELVAGAEGLEALVLHYPRRAIAATPMLARSDSPQYRVWQCELCSFAYDEAKGLPDEGIAPGTRWEDVPEDWICPDCATSKADFQMRVVG
jgi:rubredoxin